MSARDLSREELHQARVLATISRDVYNPDPNETETWERLTNAQIEGLGISSALLEETLGSQIARTDGLRVGLYKTESDEIVLAFAGTNLKSARDWVTNIRQGIGLDTDEYSKAAILARQFKMVPGKKIITGHSKGGAIASLASAVTNEPSVTFNTAGLHTKTLEREGIDYRSFEAKSAPDLITNIVLEGEILQKVNGLAVVPGPIGPIISLRGETIATLSSFERHSIDNVIETIDDKLHALNLADVNTTLKLNEPTKALTNKSKPTVFLIVGPNGAGKSTMYNAIIRPKIGAPFINADLIQKHELRDPSFEASITARDMAIERRAEFVKEGKSFVFETVFSHPTKLAEVGDFKAAGFNVVLYHIGLNSADLSVERVAQRVSRGGHDVPEDRIRGRFVRNKPFIKQAALLADRAFIYDNSVTGRALKLGVELEKGKVVSIGENLPKWQRELYATELEPFSQMRQNPAAASYNVVKRQAEEVMGGQTSVVIPKTGVRYIGPLIGESAMHYLQKTPQQFVAHFKTALPPGQKLGTDIEIVYQTQRKANVTLSPIQKVKTPKAAVSQSAQSEPNWFLAPRSLDSYAKTPEAEAEQRVTESRVYQQDMDKVAETARTVFADPKAAIGKLTQFVQTSKLTDRAVSDYVRDNLETFGPLAGRTGMMAPKAEAETRAQAVKQSRDLVIQTRDWKTTIDKQRASKLDDVNHERALDAKGIEALRPEDLKFVALYQEGGEVNASKIAAYDLSAASQKRIERFDAQIDKRFGHIATFLKDKNALSDPASQKMLDTLQQNKTMLLNSRAAASNMGLRAGLSQNKNITL